MKIYIITLASSAITTTAVSSLSYSSNYVGETFTLQFAIGLTLASSNLLLVQLPTFANGFISEDQTISCSIASVNLYCIPYYGVDMILLVVTQAFSAGNILQINNLRWPEYQSSFTTSSTIDLYRTSNTGTYISSVKFNSILNSQPNYFSVASIVIPKKGLKYIDCSFEFQFTINAHIPELSLIRITFPSNYNLLSSTPLPAVSITGLSSYSATQVLTSSFTILQITVTLTNFLKQITIMQSTKLTEFKCIP